MTGSKVWRNRWVFGSGFALVLLALGVACGGLFPTRIGDILQHPRDYDGKRVTIAGTVTQAVSLGPVRTFVVEDGTGSIQVVTGRAVPNEGEQVKVRGTVVQSFVLFGKSLVVIKEEPAD